MNLKDELILKAHFLYFIYLTAVTAELLPVTLPTPLWMSRDYNLTPPDTACSGQPAFSAWVEQTTEQSGQSGQMLGFYRMERQKEIWGGIKPGGPSPPGGADCSVSCWMKWSFLVSDIQFMHDCRPEHHNSIKHSIFRAHRGCSVHSVGLQGGL